MDSDTRVKWNKIIDKGDDMIVCLPRANVEDVTERLRQVKGNGHGGLFLGTWVQLMLRRKVRQPSLISTCRKLVWTLKEIHVVQIALSGMLSIMGSRGKYKNCRRLTINSLLQKLCVSI